MSKMVIIAAATIACLAALPLAVTPAAAFGMSSDGPNWNGGGPRMHPWGRMGRPWDRDSEDLPPCAAYEAIVREDIDGGVRRYNPHRYWADKAMLDECFRRSAY